ncbi:MAG: CehA/McbA family metallohydrolase [Candidatus Stygibacter frigidus]|nr:CehA/McbA family metallohydrolase [Candidatus Stygibacter frigidus]
MPYIPDFELLPLMAIGYAELHYHLPWLYPLYHRRQPEIIADLPHRLALDKTDFLPLSIIIKDADKYPVHLQSITVELLDTCGTCSQEIIELDIQVNSKWFSRLLFIDISSYTPNNVVFTNVNFELTCRNKPLMIKNDNFPGLSKKPFCTWLTKEGLPLPENWYAGDIHYHSDYTSDQVEFGADISSTVTMAKALGLSWFCVTDHSYDLDDTIDDFTKNDPALPKWHDMLKECNEKDSSEVRIIAGEEVSIGNNKGKNVHLLALNQKEFIDGHGDSAEVWGKNIPQHNLCEIPMYKTPENLFIAAHPLEKVSLAQKLTLRRGSWSLEDYQQGDINILQLINSDEPKKIEKDILTWTKYLLQGKKLFITAGNDAHGNFNIMRQISFPFVTLWETHKQIFGRWMTIFESTSNDPLPALATGRMIVSNGPFLAFYIHQLEDKWQMGETCPLRHGSVNYDARTTPEFGEIDTIYCYRGDLDTGKEFRFPLACPVNIALPANGYIRMSLLTTKGFTAYTNPIFTSN